MNWWRRKSREDDLSRELGAHLDLEAEEHQSSGLGPEEARFAALRAFGNRTMFQEDIRMTWQWLSVEKFTQDLRYAGRVGRQESDLCHTGNPYLSARNRRQYRDLQRGGRSAASAVAVPRRRPVGPG